MDKQNIIIILSLILVACCLGLILVRRDLARLKREREQDLYTEEFQKALATVRSHVFDTAKTLFREQDLAIFSLLGDIRVVDGVLYRFLQVSHVEPIQFQREEVNSGAVHYELSWLRESGTRTIDVWLRLGRDEFTFISWKQVGWERYDVPDHPGDRMIDLINHRLFALFEFFYYIDQFRMAFLANTSKYTLATLAVRSEEAKALYNRYDEEESQATREFFQYLEERNAAFEEKWGSLPEQDDLEDILSAQIPSFSDILPTPRGRRSEKDYDDVFMQHVRDGGSLAEGVRILENMGYSKEAARAALKRRRQQGRNSNERGRNSSE